jgi:hypothetical protein
LSGRTAAVRIANAPVKPHHAQLARAHRFARSEEVDICSGVALDSIRRHWSGKLREAFHRARFTAWSETEEDADTVNDRR